MAITLPSPSEDKRSLAVQETGEIFAPRPEQIDREQADHDEHGVCETRAIREECVVGEDVQNDRAEEQQPEIAGEGNGAQNSADEFAGFHEIHVAGGDDRPHEKRLRRACRRWRHVRHHFEKIHE